VVIAKLTPTLVVSGANGIIGPFSKIITAQEKWDFEYESVNIMVYKVWFGKLINTFIFIAIQAQRAYGSEVIQISEKLKFDSDMYECREDEAQQQLA
jgi:hypothetical protein